METDLLVKINSYLSGLSYLQLIIFLGTAVLLLTAAIKKRFAKFGKDLEGGSIEIIAVILSIALPCLVYYIRPGEFQIFTCLITAFLTWLGPEAVYSLIGNITKNIGKK